MSGNLKRQKWGREIDSGNYEEQFSITAANAALLSIVSGKVARDPSGSVPKFDIDIVFLGTAITLTDFAGFPIGTKIWAPLITAAPTLYLKKASSSTPVVGDWYYTTFTVCT